MISKILRRFFQFLGLDIKRYQSPTKSLQLVSLKPQGQSRGNVLLSYVIDPFLLNKDEPISNAHTHDWESFQIAETFLNHGYAVDVISYLNSSFVPKKNYAYFISARTNLERIARLLNTDCVVVAHLDTAHWLFNNSAAYQRLLAVQMRREITLKNVKMVEANWAIEHAHVGTVLGNQFTIETYKYAKKPLFRIPISAPCTYPWDESKNFDHCRNNFLWFGSSGFVHKGLDLVLEAFARMPEQHLTVCGPLDDEPEFVKAYHKELFDTPNIHTIGWIDVGTDQFLEITRKCIGLVYPTCSEGGGGSAITCMHAGVIPILSREASVDIDECGYILKTCSIDEIISTVSEVSRAPDTNLALMAKRAWLQARNNHTRERFASEYANFVSGILTKG